MLSVKTAVPIFLMCLIISRVELSIKTKLLEIASEQDLMIIFRLLTSSDEAEQRLLLLHVHGEDASTCLEVVLKLLVKVQGRLDLNQSSKLRVVVLDEVATLVILLYECMLSAHRDVMDSHVSLVTTTKFDLVDVVKVDNVELLLLLVIVLG